MRPHRRQPTRLPRPWDSPGKNTGVGCHFLLQCMKVKSESEVTQSYKTLSDPMDCSPPGSSVHEIFQARVLEWGAIAFSVNSLNSLSCMQKLSSHISDRLYFSPFISLLFFFKCLILILIWSHDTFWTLKHKWTNADEERRWFWKIFVFLMKGNSCLWFPLILGILHSRGDKHEGEATVSEMLACMGSNPWTNANYLLVRALQSNRTKRISIDMKGSGSVSLSVVSDSFQVHGL